ncbi:hypothetical protein [Victivallis vadensis]|jgi:hypothetical protein|uniref:hypothetical protein n=1 Tax=Victivallis vadensis TaxID=172901 RepID=UPI003CFD0C4A
MKIKMNLSSVLVKILTIATVTATAENLPWHIQDTQIVEAGSADFLLDSKWSTTHATATLSDCPTPAGDRTIEFKVNIPSGANIWPALEIKDRNFDFSGYDILRFYIKGETTCRPPIKLIFFLKDSTYRREVPLRLNLIPGEWQQVDYPLSQVAPASRISRVHFFMCGSDYLSGGSFRFQIGGFKLLKTKSVSVSTVPPTKAACMMKVSQVGHGLRLVEAQTTSIPAELTFETGSETKIEPSDTLTFRFYELFTGRYFSKNVSPKFQAAPGTVSHFQHPIPLADLPAGYYVVTADLSRNNGSLLNGMVGSDQFYIKKKNEAPAYTALSVRTGKVFMMEDLLHGGTFAYTRSELPHVYDPFDVKTYERFRKLYLWDPASANKDAEHYEAALAGLHFSHLAYRKLNDKERSEAVEKLLRNYAYYMMTSMQRPDGSVTHIVNEYMAAPGQLDGSTTIYDNQVGEWIRAMCYVILALRENPENTAFVRAMSSACRRSAEYICRNTKGDGAERVFVNTAVDQPLREPGRELARRRYRQAGVDCDVYNPRTFSGVAFYAYTAAVLGEEIPDEWWKIMRNTAEWSNRKMKPDGWYDWQCGEWEEGGCHTYLGNIYLGEAALFYYLAAREAGRTDDAALAAQVCKRAFHYVTDSCMSKGKRFEPPIDFWTGPYNYWLFEIYRKEIVEDKIFADWQNVQKQFWQGRQWRDFAWDESAGPLCPWAQGCSTLPISILAFPALYLLDENDISWSWPHAAK